MDSDFVTLLRVRGRANKLIRQDRNLKVSKEPGPPITNAIGVTIYVPDCAAMTDMLEGIADDPNAVIIPGGYFPGTAPAVLAPLVKGPEFFVSSKKFLTEHLGIDKDDMDNVLGWHEIDGQRHIARMKANMLPTSWMLFDRDEVKGMPDNLATMSDADWLAAMCSMVPGLDKIQMVKVASSTGRVLVDGEPMSASGRHYYVPVVGGQDIERFGATLLQRSFLNEYGFMRPLFSKEDPDEIVGYRQWSIFDPTTFSRERLVYEGAPTLKGKGLELAPPQIEVL